MTNKQNAWKGPGDMENEEVQKMPPMEETDETTENGKSVVVGLYEWVGAAIFSLAFVVLVFTFLFRIVGVVGNSMNPTLSWGDRLIITRIGYTPQQGDIVIVNRYTEEPLVKRVVAIGGDTLRIDDETGTVYVNGEALDEPYIQGHTYSLGLGTEEQTVPAGTVFVMGDNREHSKDSRYIDEVGFVNESDIIGKAIFRFLPLSEAKSLY